MISSTEWLLTVGVLAAVIVFDLALAIIRRNKETTTKEALSWTLFYIAAAIAFGLLLPRWGSDQLRELNSLQVG